MTWRSVIIANPARLSYQHRALVVEQQGQSVSVPLEDIAALVLEHQQVVLTVPLLSACAEAGIAVITVDAAHTPNGVLLPYLQHSRTLQVMRRQLALRAPLKKRLWQGIVKRKLINQAALLRRRGQTDTAARLMRLAGQVRSGDPGNLEAQGAQAYFPALFGVDFTRGQGRFYNAALNYAYSIVRSALARSLVGYGFLPAFGIHHHSEQNAFNLADDLFEPYRAVTDAWVLRHYPEEPGRELEPGDKAILAGVLNHDAPRLAATEYQGRSSLLALIEATVISLGQRLQDAGSVLVLPGLGDREDEPGD